MGAARGVLTGALGLVVLEVALTNADSVSSLIQLVGGDGHPGSGLVGRALSPDVAAIPNRAGNRTSSTPAASTAPAPAYPTPGTLPAPQLAPAAGLPYSPNLN